MRDSDQSTRSLADAGKWIFGGAIASLAFGVLQTGNLFELTPALGLAVGTIKVILLLSMVVFLWALFYLLDYFSPVRQVELTDDELDRLIERLYNKTARDDPDHRVSHEEEEPMREPNSIGLEEKDG